MHYDEFGLLAENAAEAELPWTGPPSVHREFFAVPSANPGPGQAGTQDAD